MRRSILLLALLSLANAGDEPQEIRLIVRQVIAQAPATLTAKVILERHAENRQLHVEIDGPDYFQSGDEHVAGAQDQRVWDKQWKNVPCGKYRITALVLRSAGKTY